MPNISFVLLYLLGLVLDNSLHRFINLICNYVVECVELFSVDIPLQLILINNLHDVVGVLLDFLLKYNCLLF